MALRLVTGPASEPLTLAEAKKQCEIPTAVTDHDTYVTELIVVAREAAEHKTNRALYTQTWIRTMDAFPDGIPLRKSPIQSVSWIHYLDVNGDQQTLATDQYTVDTENEPGWVVPAYGLCWPTTYCSINSVQAQYIAGWTTVPLIPSGIKHWMKLRIAAMFANREEVTDPESRSASIVLPFADSLLDRYWLPEL